MNSVPFTVTISRRSSISQVKQIPTIAGCSSTPRRRYWRMACKSERPRLRIFCSIANTKFVGFTSKHSILTPNPTNHQMPINLLIVTSHSPQAYRTQRLMVRGRLMARGRLIPMYSCLCCLLLQVPCCIMPSLIVFLVFLMCT